jgi:Arc/MetJ family transcription regulator
MAVARTNIEIDDELIGRVMERFGFTTKREAVHESLRQMLGGIEPMTKEEMLAMRGAGWGDGTLEVSDMRDQESIDEL